MTEAYFNLRSSTLLMLFFSCTLAFSQQMVEQNKLWSYYYGTGSIGDGPGSHPTGVTLIYSFGMPEIIEGQTYYRLRSTHSEFSYQAFWENTDSLMREDTTGKIFLKEDGFPEVLIYDFSLAVNDIFIDQGGCSLELVSKDSIELNSGGLWERFNFDDGQYGQTWIKGVGSTSAIIPDCIVVGPEGLLCFQTGDDLEYTGDLFAETTDFCYFLPVSTEEISPSSISVFPNPVWHTLTIQSKEEALSGPLFIYNAMGQQVLQTTVRPTLRQEVDLRLLPAGVYYLELNGKKEQFIKG